MRAYSTVVTDSYSYNSSSPDTALWTGCGPGYYSLPCHVGDPPFQQCDPSQNLCHVLPVSNPPGYLNSENLACTHIPSPFGSESGQGCGMDAAIFSYAQYNWQTGTRMIDTLNERYSPGARNHGYDWCLATAADNNYHHQMIHYITLYDNTTGSYVRLVAHIDCNTFTGVWFAYLSAWFIDQSGTPHEGPDQQSIWSTETIDEHTWLDLTIQLSHDGQALLKVYNENTFKTYTKTVSTIVGTVNHSIGAGANYRHNEKSSTDSISFTSAYQPTQPTVSGPTAGQTGSYYSYQALSATAETPTVQYDFDWGDGYRDLSGFVPTGTSVTLSHMWPAGTYQVRVLTVDSHGTYSDWSASLIVTITQSGGGGGGGCRTGCPNGPTP